MSTIRSVDVIGRCRKCKRAYRATATVTSRTDSYGRVTRSYQIGTDRPSHGLAQVQCACGERPYLEPIQGFVTDSPCDARCTSATGRKCECGCGGKNHGLDHQLAEVRS